MRKKRLLTPTVVMIGYDTACDKCWLAMNQATMARGRTWNESLTRHTRSADDVSADRLTLCNGPHDTRDKGRQYNPRVEVWPVTAEGYVEAGQ